MHLLSLNKLSNLGYYFSKTDVIAGYLVDFILGAEEIYIVQKVTNLLRNANHVQISFRG